MTNIFIKNHTVGFKLSLASPNLIIKWSLKYLNKVFIIGEVSEPFTINFKTGYPEVNGLFCEKIFGPLFSWKCRCGINYNFLKNNINLNSFCNFCGIELNNNNVRRWRMGFINLTVPIAHKWYIKDIIPFFLNIPANEFKILIYYKIFPLFFTKQYYKTNISKWVFSKLIFITQWFKQILKEFNLLNELLFCKEIYYDLYYSNNNLKKILIKKFNILYLFLLNNINPEWLFLTVLPVIPVGLRPLVKIQQKTFVSSPINNLYKTIILRNNRLKRWKMLRYYIPLFFELIDKQLLQYSIDSLLNITTKTSYISPYFNLQGKTGKFRQFLLGKRIDFSGRSVIVPGSDLLYKHIGLSMVLSLELFKPLLYNFLKKTSSITTLLRASYITQYNPIILKRILKFILTKEIILVNRAPTLHRMNIQAFKPYLIESESIKLFPIACTSFNADFDGDQMGLFLILSKVAKKEAKKLLAFDKNIFSPAYLKNMFKLSQSMILGISALLNLKGNAFSNIIFSSSHDVLTSYFHNLLKLDSPIWVRYLEKNIQSNIIYKKYILSTLGRILLQYYLQLLS